MDVEMSEAEASDLGPIKILIDELRNDEAHTRLKSIRHLTTIATALGPERTRVELVPYLNGKANKSTMIMNIMSLASLFFVGNRYGFRNGR